MKKLISFVLVLTMLLTTICTVIPAGADSADSFIDVASDAWYRDAVDYVSLHGIMGGAGNVDTFKPLDLSTRAMIAVILHRLEGEAEPENTSPFTDLKADWYVTAVNWAYENKIVNGTSDTTFNPDGNITRQEIATMLCRYIAFKGFDTESEDVTHKYYDGKDVASWATDAVSWAANKGIMTGRQEDGKILLAPTENTQRCEMATIFRRICENFNIGPEAGNSGSGSGPDYDEGETFFPATLQEIIDDIKSDRVKKVIIDADAGNEIDDQYAIAYAIASERMDVVSINASQFLNTALVPTREAGMLEGYNEVKRVLKLIGREDIPVYKGVGTSVTKPDDGGIGLPTVTPVNADAVDNIINTAKSSNEIVYIIVTGCATNVSCAIAKDPSIKDKICVIWLGANHYDTGGAFGEFNIGQDETAGRYLMNNCPNLIWIPAQSKDSTKGSQVMKSNKAFLTSSFTGSDDASEYFREGLPREHDGSFDGDGWVHTFWDVVGTAVLDCPELIDFEIVPLRRIRGDGVFSDDLSGRPKGIIMQKVKEPQTVLDNMAAAINSLVK